MEDVRRVAMSDEVGDAEMGREVERVYEAGICGIKVGRRGSRLSDASSAFAGVPYRSAWSATRVPQRVVGCASCTPAHSSKWRAIEPFRTDIEDKHNCTADRTHAVV